MTQKPKYQSETEKNLNKLPTPFKATAEQTSKSLLMSLCSHLPTSLHSINMDLKQSQFLRSLLSVTEWKIR